MKSDAALRFEMIPHVGIGPVRLGMTLDEVSAALAKYPGALPARGSEPSLQRYFKSSLTIEYGQSGTVQFVEVCARGPFKTIFKGKNVFDVAAPDLFALFASGEPAGTHIYDGCGYIFPAQIIAVSDADEQYDTPDDNGRAIYATVGIGNADYLKAIGAIASDGNK